MQACLPIVPDRRINRQPAFEQKGDDVGSTVLARPGERRLHLFRRRNRLEPALGVEVVLHEIEAADARCAFEVQPRAARREVFRRGAASVGQASRDQRMIVSGGARTIDLRAVVDQDLHQRVLHAGALGVNAGRDEAERRATAAVHVRLGVDLGARREQRFRDGHGVVRRLLAVVLDAVGRCVVQQHGAVLARRTGANQRRLLMKEPLQCRNVAGNDRFGRRFEHRDRRLLLLEILQVRGEYRPALEAVGAREHELRSGQRAVAGRECLPSERLELRNRLGKLCGPRADGAGFARPARRGEIVRMLLVLLQTRA